MKAKLNIIATLLILFSFSSISMANTEAKGDNPKDVKKEIKKTIKHHLKDAHYFELYHGVKMALPVIVWDQGLKFYSSSSFKKNYFKFVSLNDSCELSTNFPRHSNIQRNFKVCFFYRDWRPCIISKTIYISSVYFSMKIFENSLLPSNFAPSLDGPITQTSFSSGCS